MLLANVTLIVLLIAIVCLTRSLARARSKCRRLDAYWREAETHAVAMECQRDAARCERDRAYESLVALSGQVDRLEQQLAEQRRPMMLKCGQPLITLAIPVGDKRGVVTHVGKN